jgi:hypothetical protein
MREPPIVSGTGPERTDATVEYCLCGPTGPARCTTAAATGAAAPLSGRCKIVTIPGAAARGLTADAHECTFFCAAGGAAEPAADAARGAEETGAGGAPCSESAAGSGGKEYRGPPIAAMAA